MEGGIAVPLGKLVGLVLHDWRAVNINRNIPAECLIEQVILRSRRKIFVTTDDMCNAHQVVVYNICEVVGRHAIGFNQNLVIQRAVFYGDIAINFIVECGCAIERHLLADNIRNTSIQLFLNFFRCQIPAVPVIHRGDVRSFLNLPDFFEPFLAAEAVVSVTALDQLFCIALEHAHPFRLHIRANRAADIRTFVPLQASDAEGVIDNINRPFDIPFLVGIFDSENKVAVIFFCQQIGIQSGSQVADVHIAGRAWCKPCSDTFFHEKKLPFV